MVDESNARQFEGFDYNDYVFFNTSAWTWDFNDGAGQVISVQNIQLYIAGTQANAQVAPALPSPPLGNMAFIMAQTPQPAVGAPATSIGPQYPWPFHGTAAGPLALDAIALNNIVGRPLSNPLNNAPVQKTLFRVVTNDMYVYMLDQKMATYLYTVLNTAPALAYLGPGTFVLPLWPLPVPVLLEADIGQYEFERKWIWLLAVRAVAGNDADLHVYMEG